MSNHTIMVSSIGRISRLVVICSCGDVLLEENLAALDELNQLAHEHIEAAERYGERPCPRPGHKHPA